MMPSSTDESLFAQAFRLVRDRACAGILMKDVLSQLHISRSTIERLFKQNLGHSFNQELMQVRLEESRRLLRTTDTAVKRIAQMVGCRSSSNFCKFFRKQTGMTPGEFRSRHGLIKDSNNYALSKTPHNNMCSHNSANAEIEKERVGTLLDDAF